MQNPRHILRRGASLCLRVFGKRVKLKLQNLNGVADLEQLTDLPPGVSIEVLQPARYRFRRRNHTSSVHLPLAVR
ncbi:hypothetical protein A3H90_02340 [Candidatus Peribacteria bacterium RIFCSPLOWO2_02_FULL_55_36]|nr:MAG: hypothetical protein A3H90_02340 [Candidatus Peribacteria bacterium RIFCSPLOWO2_02_FULL_55_36]